MIRFLLDSFLLLHESNFLGLARTSRISSSCILYVCLSFSLHFLFSPDFSAKMFVPSALLHVHLVLVRALALLPKSRVSSGQMLQFRAPIRILQDAYFPICFILQDKTSQKLGSNLLNAFSLEVHLYISSGYVS